MKQFLLMAVAVMITCTANAQKLGKHMNGKVAQKSVNISSQQEKLQKNAVVMPSVKQGGKLSSSLYDADVRLAKEARGLKAGSGVFTPASRRAATVQATYDAYGTDVKEGSVKWNMTSGSDNGRLILTNVIPEIPDVLTNVSVEYTISGSTIEVAPQLIGTYSYVDEKTNKKVVDYLFVFTDNGTGITMTLNEDGSISTDDAILYAGFSTNKFDATLNTYTGYYEYLTKISYLLPGQVKAPTVQYEPDGLYLHVGTSPTWYAYSTSTFMYLPVDVATRFWNYTQDEADTWSWSMDKLKVNAEGTDYEVDETLTSDKASFSVAPEPGSLYYQPILKASKSGAESQPYQWSVRGSKTIGYVHGGGSTTHTFTDGSIAQISKCDPANRVTTAGYLATPTINTNNYTFSNLIFYQGKPAAPVYFEGISLWVGGFTKQDDFTLKCKLVKVTRDPNTLRLTLGDVIAESDVDLTDIVLDESDASDIWAQLNWNSFYVEDEFGMSEEKEYLQIEDEFAVVFEGWNNGTFTAMPVVEFSGDMVNTVSTTSLYVQQPGSDSVLGFFNNYSHPYVSFKGALYGWLHTEDSKDVVIPTEGGNVGIHVEPCFSGNDDEGNTITSLWLAEGEEMPDWLKVGFANEKYTEEEFSFDLVFEAEALPDGTEGRQAKLKFEQWGSKLEVTVTQGTVTGVSVVKTDVKSANAQMYNHAGQRVNNGFKGLVIKNGRKFMNK